MPFFVLQALWYSVQVSDLMNDKKIPLRYDPSLLHAAKPQKYASNK